MELEANVCIDPGPELTNYSKSNSLEDNKVSEDSQSISLTKNVEQNHSDDGNNLDSDSTSHAQDSGNQSGHEEEDLSLETPVNGKHSMESFDTDVDDSEVPSSEQNNGSKDSNDDLENVTSYVTSIENEESNYATPKKNDSKLSNDSVFSSMNSLQKDVSYNVGDSDEEYFEEYHLPNTHENTFVRHLSFRRKVQSIPINAPDAERIEGLVRTGEFVRHNSIRRKIVPEETPIVEEEDEYAQLQENDSNSNHSSSFSERIENDISEIERYLSEERLDDAPLNLPIINTPINSKKLKRTTSTPKASSGTPDCAIDLDNSSDMSLNSADKSLEDCTLRKIQECLDFSTYKDILNLSGRLSDILSPKEVEEVLINSERYRKYLDSEVFEALSISFQGQTQSLPYFNINGNNVSQLSNSSGQRSNSQSNSPMSIPVTDSGFSSPKANKKSLKPIHNEMRIIEKPSTPIGGIAAPGIFIESESNSNPNLRKIAAPQIDLDSSPEGGKTDESDEELSSEESSEKILHVRSELMNGINNSADILVHTGSSIIQTHLNINEHHKESDTSSDLDEITSEPEIFPPLPPPDLIPELSAAEELADIRHWRNVVIGGAWRRIDMKVIAPYRQCVSHGGYMEGTQSPIVVLSASLLPEKSRRDYHYVMDNLFVYVLSFVEQLLSDDYVLVYFSHVKHNWSGPGFHWMRKAYDMIDRRLKKNLKELYVVHPSLWSKTILTLCRPFVSKKFYRKIHYVPNLIQLADFVPLEQLSIPESVKQADFEVMIREKKAKRVA